MRDADGGGLAPLIVVGQAIIRSTLRYKKESRGC